MLTLGINSAFHDSSACIVRDGVVLAAAEEERFTAIKHAKRPVPFSTWELPFHAIDYCLRAAGATLRDVSHVGYSYNPHILLGEHMGGEAITLPLEPSASASPGKWESPWDPLFLSSIVNAPRHLVSGTPHRLKSRFSATGIGDFAWQFVDHHLTHAASAFHPSPFRRAAVLTLDGRGEQATTASWHGDGNDLRLLSEVKMPHSLGILYERVTEYLGFLHSSDEYKVMALTAFGKPAYLADFRDIVDVQPGGQYTTTGLKLEERFGPPREPGAALEQRHFDVACSLQQVLEESVLELVHWLHRETGEDNLCLAGGVALNCLMNARIEKEGPFRNVWVQPAAGDAGTSLGAALWVDATVRKDPTRHYEMEHPYLGPEFGDAEIEAFLKWSKLPYRRPQDIPGETADLLVREKVIGWFQGRMEFGPRSLGARSILASPIPATMQARLNDIKDREDFRPVAPVVLEEEAQRWFRCSGPSPFMLFTYEVRPLKAHLIPAVRHVDGSARIQTIRRSQHALYYDTIKAFADRTGVPILVNTSFNTRGQPIVCTPRHAVESFWSSPLDALVIGPFVIEKVPQ